ncbi:MAG TPA: NAD(P)H-dependent oxidoreductase [Planosporangium sp.]|jgi:FMN-dependent NADH-azoreductase|nr:NAD(P)H-dependent oxidoreductase [Planosporangium sp.]
MTLFRLDASIRSEGSISREIADTVQVAWQAEHPDPKVIRRDIGAEPLPARAWLSLVGGRSTPSEQAGASALATTLVDELVEADAYLFAVPLYNFGVPQHVKAWVDLLITDSRLRPGAERPLAGRPAVLVVTRGGGYGPGSPREGWDHGTPWLRRIFADVFGLDLLVVETELTLAGVNPAMEALRGLADKSLHDARSSAAAHGRAIAQRVRAGV